MAERMALDLAHRGERSEIFQSQRALSPTTYGAIAAVMMVVAGLAGVATATVAREDIVRPNPVVATRTETTPTEAASPEIVPSTAISMTPAEPQLWPAALADDQTPWHFASDVAGTR